MRRFAWFSAVVLLSSLLATQPASANDHENCTSGGIAGVFRTIFCLGGVFCSTRVKECVRTGGRDIPPPPPPPPPPPCNTGPFIVFFDFGEAVIPSDGEALLDQAINAYGNCGPAGITLAGHTDRQGDVSTNLELSERRNATVTAYLISRGIPADRISSEGFGESQPRVPTADGVRDQQNNRVEITYSRGSRM